MSLVIAFYFFFFFALFDISHGFLSISVRRRRDWWRRLHRSGLRATPNPTRLMLRYFEEDIQDSPG
jgi:hypothetical protein